MNEADEFLNLLGRAPSSKQIRETMAHNDAYYSGHPEVGVTTALCEMLLRRIEELETKVKALQRKKCCRI